MKSIRNAMSVKPDEWMTRLSVQAIDSLRKLPLMAKYKSRLDYWKIKAFVTQTDFATLDVSSKAEIGIIPYLICVLRKI